MKRITFLLSILILSFVVSAQDNSGEIHGKLIDADSKEPLAYTGVFVEIGTNKFGANTSDDGKFIIKPLPPGTYDLMCILLNGETQKIMTGIVVKPNKIAFADTVLAYTESLPPIEIVGYPIKLIDPEDPTAITRGPKEIAQSADVRNLSKMISTFDSGIKIDDNNNMSYRGGRENDMVAIVDGVKMSRLPNLPASAYESITAYLGGLPAKYGDTTGGVIIIESKSYFDYYRQWKAQQEIKN